MGFRAINGSAGSPAQTDCQLAALGEEVRVLRAQGLLDSARVANTGPVPPTDA